MYTGAGRIGLLRPSKLPNLVEGRDGVRDWSCGKAGLFTITPIKWSFQVRPEALFFSWGLRNHNQPVLVLSGAASSHGGAGPRQSILQLGTGHLPVPARHLRTGEPWLGKYDYVLRMEFEVEDEEERGEFSRSGGCGRRGDRC